MIEGTEAGPSANAGFVETNRADRLQPQTEMTAEVLVLADSDTSLTDTMRLQQEDVNMTPLEMEAPLTLPTAMHSLHLDSPLLKDRQDAGRPESAIAPAEINSLEDQMYSHHALLALQDTLQQQSTPRPTTPNPAPTQPSTQPPPASTGYEALSVGPAVVVAGGRPCSPAQQRRLDAYYLRLQAYHLQRALADEEKQQLDERRDRILERHTITRVKHAMRQQQQRQQQRDALLHQHTYPDRSTLTDTADSTPARQVDVAALREARLASKHRQQQLHADAAAQRQHSAQQAEQQLRRAQHAAQQTAADRQQRVQRQRAERARRAFTAAAEREASANFVSVANSVAQQVGQLERREWRERLGAEVAAAVQRRRRAAAERSGLVQAVCTENYHRRQINAVLQHQAAEAQLAQRQQAMIQRQQQHRLALLSVKATHKSGENKATVMSQSARSVSSLAAETSALPVEPVSVKSSFSSTSLIGQRSVDGSDGSSPIVSPLAPLLFLLESKAKREAERKPIQPLSTDK